MMRWGLVPRWAKDLKVGYRMINAKAENLTSSRAYSPLVGKFRHRCLIVADGFYEWMKAEDPKQPRQPWRFTVDGGEPFAFAGLCTRKEWEDDEERGVEDGWLYSCTIVTTTPNEVVAKVHDRMPVILPVAEAEAAWLRPDLERRGRDRDVRAAAGRADGGRAGQPEAEQGRERDRGAGAAGRPGLGGAARAADQPPAGLRRRGAGGRCRWSSMMLTVGGVVVRQIEAKPSSSGSFERAARQPPLPFLQRLFVGGPADDDAGLVDEPAQRVVEFERRGVGAVRVELDDDFIREVLLEEVFAAARPRVGGAAARASWPGSSAAGRRCGTSPAPGRRRCRRRSSAPPRPGTACSRRRFLRRR